MALGLDYYWQDAEVFSNCEPQVTKAYELAFPDSTIAKFEC